MRTTPAGRAFLQIQVAFAEMERNVSRQPGPDHGAKADGELTFQVDHPVGQVTLSDNKPAPVRCWR